MSKAPKAKSSKTKSSKINAETTSSSDSTAKADSGSTDSATSSDASKEPAKSGRESMGGAGAVHYGFFSNVKTEEYRSGWDAIWGDKNKKNTKSKATSPAKAKAKKKEPVFVDLEFDDLPRELQEGLAEAARKHLKKSRVNYDTRVKAGAVSWRLECEVRR